MDKEGITTGDILLGYQTVPNSLENLFHVGFLSVSPLCISFQQKKLFSRGASGQRVASPAGQCRCVLGCQLSRGDGMLQGGRERRRKYGNFTNGFCMIKDIKRCRRAFRLFFFSSFCTFPSAVKHNSDTMLVNLPWTQVLSAPLALLIFE